MERRPALVDAVIAGKLHAMSLRSKVGARLKRIMADPAGIYNVPLYLKRRAIRCLSKYTGIVRRRRPAR
jgi:hypothetical protein